MAPGDRRRIALLAPMLSELRPILKRVSLTKSAGEKPPIYSGRHGDVELVVTTTSMGTVAAARAAERILDHAPIDHVIVVGIAGGVDPTFEIGDVFVPSAVIDGATGIEYTPHRLGDLPPGGKLSTSDEFIIDQHRLDRLAEQGVVAVDMETSAIAAVCERRDTPWTAFRAISDRAIDGDLEMLNMANPDGSPHLGNALRYVARRPWKIPFLLGLAKGATKAADAAAEAAIRACASR